MGKVLKLGETIEGYQLFCRAEDVVTDSVDGMMLSPEFPAKTQGLVMLGEGLLISRDGGQSWSGWKSVLPFDQGMASVAAPQGLDSDAPLLLGLIRGGVLRI